LKHLGTKTIETERLILRRFQMEDAKDMYQNWASDPEVTRFLTWPAHPSIEVSKVVIAGWMERYSELDYYQWAIALKPTGQAVIGSIGVTHINDDVGKVEIGYCIGRKYWRQGIMSEALKALIDFFINEVGVNRVEAKHDPNNPNSGNVMKKCGMRYEGTLRQSDRNNQGICDCAWYAILARDYAKKCGGTDM